jgi:hypothetical protein
VRRLRARVAVLIAAAFAAGAGCALRGPVLDTGSKPEGVGGTIAGIVSTSAATPVSGRRVSAVDTVKGTRYEASTAVNGGYTIKVPVGRYRLEVELRDGETLAEKPADTDINPSDMDADRDFVIAVRPPASR